MSENNGHTAQVQYTIEPSSTSSVLCGLGPKVLTKFRLFLLRSQYDLSAWSGVDALIRSSRDSDECCGSSSRRKWSSPSTKRVLPDESITLSSARSSCSLCAFEGRSCTIASPEPANKNTKGTSALTRVRDPFRRSEMKVD